VTSLTAVIKEPYADSRHVLVTIFAGPDADHRANCGTLHMLWDEALELERRLKDAPAARNKETS
jgi:hypothetical protein